MLNQNYMRRALLLCFCCILLSLLPTSVQAQSVTLEAYQQQIRAAYAAAQRSNRIDLDQVAAELSNVTSVALPDQTSVPVNNSWLREALAQEPPDYSLIEGRLGALLEALNQPRTMPDPDALNKLQGVFEQPPFKDREVPGSVRAAWNNFWRGVGDAISNFFDWIFGNAPTPQVQPPAPPRVPNVGFTGLSPLSWVLLVVGVLLVLALVGYAIRGIRGSMVRDAKAKREAAEEETLTSTEAMERAQTEVRGGDYRTAVRYLYLSSLLWLHEQRLLRYDRSLTNREYLEQVRDKPLHGQLTPIVDTFDRVWYGKRPLDDGEFAAYEEQITALRGPQERTP